MLPIAPGSLNPKCFTEIKFHHCGMNILSHLCIIFIFFISLNLVTHLLAIKHLLSGTLSNLFAGKSNLECFSLHTNKLKSLYLSLRSQYKFFVGLMPNIFPLKRFLNRNFRTVPTSSTKPLSWFLN